ncbi:GNAT family N-acetyltransferase [Streptomyces sp. NBC_01216]|uniref:GNAT family N-acetyltransferase n=1 Tax=unclassified Streptomyces TaxID=2593676 RepID=UPI002E1297C5|nr:GNAT family N-acetyltransferase [Streptomyces sp. NBC_01216]
MKTDEGRAPLRTERLLLRLLTPAEAERIVNGTPGAEDRWGRGYPSDGDVAGAAGFLRMRAEHGDPGVFGAYEIRRRADGEAVGGIGFHGPPDSERFVTVGYGLSVPARGRGFAREALGALVRFAREAGVAGVKGDADLDNIPSRRVMEAAGMSCVGEDERVRYYRLAFTPGG